MNHVAADILMHYGVKRRSGRYPWGSGKEPYQHSGDFLSRIEELQGKGYSESDIAKELDITTTDLRMQIRVAKHERRALMADRARSLRDDGLTLQEIAEKMGFSNDSSVRALLNEQTAENKNRAKATADILRQEVEKKGMIDVGAGVEYELGCTQNALKEAVFILETQGYNRYGIGIPQATNPSKQTITTVLTKPDISYEQVYKNMGDIQPVGDYHSTDGGSTYSKLQYPQSIDSSRVFIRYGDQGGTDKDGVIELRRGVADLDLGNSHYAQVRILVDGTHYLKGMAMYSDDIPEGHDIVFNTNKPSSKSKHEVMKGITDDPENPFGASIKANGQSTYIGPDGKPHLSAINKLREEGEWETMSKNLSSQFLSKQPVSLIRRQLDLTYKDMAAEYDEIMSLTNPTIKKKLLLDFANECDGAVVHLQAAALPRQSTKVLLPMPSMREDQVYAPTYRDGEKIALIRYPHGGIFEIPVLTVNNRNKKARETLDPTIKDAIGIHPKVAQQLSGADFDGDFVITFPVNDRVQISHSKPLQDLIGFDPKEAYPYVEGMRVMSKKEKQKQMGSISNLITDMTLKGANESEIARAVRHSMVVIDAEKHKLNYRQSEKDNGIDELKAKYQGYVDESGKRVGGASTLLSRREQEVAVPERRGSGRIDKETGEVVYKTTGRTYVDPKTGKTVPATTNVPLLNYVDDVRKLSSGTAQEDAYADYANKLKALANEARKSYASSGNLVYKPESAVIYKNEVSSLNDKLSLASRNAPKERRAQAIVASKIKAMVQDNPSLKNDKKELRKIKNTLIINARIEVGASGKDTRITITDREWEAIQAGAISDSKLSKILRYADEDVVRERATPKTRTTLSPAKIAKLKAMVSSGFNNTAEIADALGVSVSTVIKYMND